MTDDAPRIPCRAGGTPPAAEQPRRRGARLTLTLLLACFSALAWGGILAPGVELIRVGDERHPVVEKADRSFHIHLPYFDATGALRWDDRPVTAGAGSCEPPPLERWKTAPRCRLRTHVSRPRLDECRCEGVGESGAALVWTTFQGGDGTTWRRDRCDLQKMGCAYVADVTPSGLIFSDHEVWSIDTGEMLRPRAAHLRQQHGASLYLPRRGLFVEFQADKDLLSSRGGLWLADPVSGKRELIRSLESGLTGYWLTEQMVELPGTDLILQAERWSTRGKGDLRLTLFNPWRRELLYSEKVWNNCWCSDIHLQPGPQGQVALSFFDGREFVVIHYRLKGVARDR